MKSPTIPAQTNEASGSGEKPVIYVKALPLREYGDIEKIKDEIAAGNILIVKLTPLAIESIEAVKNAIEELKTYTQSIGGDIARLGEERIVLTPPNVKIWRRTSKV